jgi:hypothetical protein
MVSRITKTTRSILSRLFETFIWFLGGAVAGG